VGVTMAIRRLSPFIAGRPTGRPRRFRATLPSASPSTLTLPMAARIGGASETPPLPSCAAPDGSFLMYRELTHAVGISLDSG